MNSWRMALGIVALLTVASCSSSKKAARQKKTTDTLVTAPIDTPRATPRHLDTVAATTPTPNAVDSTALKLANAMAYQPLWSRSRAFQTFKGKAQMSYEANGESKDFTAHFRLQKDQAIWVSVTALGGVVNVARALLTPDSIKAVIYLEKEFIEMPMSEVEQLLPTRVEFAMLQNLIVGNPLMPAGTPLDFTEFGGALQFLFQQADKVQGLSYNKADSSLQRNLLKAENAHQQMTVQLSKYEASFAKARTIHILNAGKPVLITMDFKEAEFDQPIELPFSIPKNYKRRALGR